MGSLGKCPTCLILASLCPQEEEERKAREEQARREHEEYLKLKEAFVVEEEGVGETMTEEQVGHGSWEAQETQAAWVRPECSHSISPRHPWLSTERRAGIGIGGAWQSEPCSQNSHPSPWEALLLLWAGHWVDTQAGGTQRAQV